MMRILRCSLCLATVLFATISLRASAAERPPNIVLILVDDLGINDLGCDGRKEHHTPHLDRLAAEGLRFTSAYCAQPICSPSRAALMTGRSPARLHLTTYLPGRADAATQKLLHPTIRQQLPLEEVTLAESLRKVGYATGCFGKWHLGGGGFGPREQGFDEFFAGHANTKPSEREGGKGEFELTAKAEAFLAAHREGPFFLYLTHNTPHVPLAAQQDLVDKHRDTFNPIYAAMVESMDASVGRLLTKLQELKLTDNTIVIFISDNGGLHVPELPHTPATHNSPFRAGKGYLYEGGLRVPLIVRWPGRIKPGVTSQPIVNTDLPVTLAALASVKLASELDGIDLSPLWLGRGELPARPLTWHFPHYTNQGGRPGGAIRQGKWKLIEHYEDGKLELFDLANDPGEQRDLASSERPRAVEMQAQLAAWRTKVGAQENTPNPRFDAEAARPLYVDVDTSLLPVTKTARESAERLAPWRAAMDAAIRTNSPKQGKDASGKKP